MNTEKQRQCRRDDARLTESGNARSEQLLVVPTESLTNREWLPGELLSGSERQRPSWYLDMKYQTCSPAVFKCACGTYIIIVPKHGVPKENHMNDDVAKVNGSDPPNITRHFPPWKRVWVQGYLTPPSKYVSHLPPPHPHLPPSPPHKRSMWEVGSVMKPLGYMELSMCNSFSSLYCTREVKPPLSQPLRPINRKQKMFNAMHRYCYEGIGKGSKVHPYRSKVTGVIMCQAVDRTIVLGNTIIIIDTWVHCDTQSVLWYQHVLLSVSKVGPKVCIVLEASEGQKCITTIRSNKRHVDVSTHMTWL